jgi:hypothetical protein
MATLVMAVPAWAASNVFVTDVSPDGGATSVAADSNITAQFGKAMRASTIKGSTFYLKKQGSSTKIPAQVSYSGISKTATLNPESNLEAGATYTATLKGGRRGVRASDGGKLGGTNDSTATFANGKVTWSFTVANDPPPPPVDECPDNPDRTEPPCDTSPTVVSFQPPGGIAGPSTNVEATFSVDMDPTSITDQTFTLTRQGASSPVAAQLSYDSETKTATLDPDSNLFTSTFYTAFLKGGSGGVKDLEGNALDHDYSWTFMPCDGGVVLSGDISPQIVVCG